MTNDAELQELIEARLRQVCKVDLPIMMTVQRKDGRAIRVYFKGTQSLRDFADFIDELIKGVREKTLEEVKTHG